jgi:ABC-type uncharacterized transport system substrate-binding protein
MGRGRVSIGVGAALLWAGAVAAHPHGTMQCSLAAHFDGGQLQTIEARLVMDAPHSSQALAILRDATTGQMDPAGGQRFLFALRQQLARHNWLLGVERGGRQAELTGASEPALELTSDDRLAVRINLGVGRTAETGSGVPWQLSCRDPGWYWVSEFSRLDQPVQVSGCPDHVVFSPVKVATGPLAGSVQVSVDCRR